MLSDIGDISSIQADGAAPSVLVAGGAAGESGVRVVKLKYQGGAHFAASLHQHVITFMSQGPIYCRVAGKALSHEAQEGSLAVLPAGIDAAACDRSADATSLLICVEPGRFGLGGGGGERVRGRAHRPTGGLRRQLAASGAIVDRRVRR